MNILSPSELAGVSDPLEFHVDSLLPVRSLVTLWAPSGVGKTFLMLDLSMHIAAGRPWQGRAVKQGAVLYVVGEGFSGMHLRVHAWCQEHGIEAADLDGAIGFRRVPFAVESTEACDEVRAELVDKRLAPAVIVLDTLSSNASPGFDESKTADMKLLLDGARSLRDEYNCTVVLVHHTGHDQSRERGSSDLRAAMDVSLSLKSTSGDARTLTIEKARDFSAPDPIPLALRERHGARIIDRMEARDEGLKPAQRAVLRVLAEEGQGEAVRAADWKRASGYAEGHFYRLREELEKLKLILNVPKKGYVLTEGGLAVVTQLHAAEELSHSHSTLIRQNESGIHSLSSPLSIRGEWESDGSDRAA
jgi:hypothetical protein